MSETFRELIDLFPDRQALAALWSAKVPEGMKVTPSDVNMWRHRDRIPAWSWAGFEAAAAVLGQTSVTIARLQAADLEVERQRSQKRRGAA